jgi:uncharacterized protein with NAD-binding domain and iron-sulfur cluster
MVSKKYLASTTFFYSAAIKVNLYKYTVLLRTLEKIHNNVLHIQIVYEAKKYQSCTHGAATALPVPYQPTPSISLTMNKCQAAKN